MTRNIDIEFREKIATEIRYAEIALDELRKLYTLVASRTDKQVDAVRMQAFDDERLPNGPARSRPSTHSRATTASARVIAAIGDAGEPLLASEIKERLPMLAEPTVRSVLFHETKEGRLVKTGPRPFRWFLAHVAGEGGTE